MKVTFSIVGIGVSSPMLDRAVLDEPREFEASSSANTKAAVGKLAKADAQMKVALVVLVWRRAIVDRRFGWRSINYGATNATLSQ